MAKRLMRFGIVLVVLTTVLVLLKGASMPSLRFTLAAGRSSGFMQWCPSTTTQPGRGARFQPPSPALIGCHRAIRLIALAHLADRTLDAGRWHLAEVPGVRIALLFR